MSKLALIHYESSGQISVINSYFQSKLWLLIILLKHLKNMKTNLILNKKEKPKQNKWLIREHSEIGSKVSETHNYLGTIHYRQKKRKAWSSKQYLLKQIKVNNTYCWELIELCSWWQHFVINLQVTLSPLPPRERKVKLFIITGQGSSVEMIGTWHGHDDDNDDVQLSLMHPSCCITADMLFQDASSYNYLSNGNLPVSGWDDATDLQDSLVSAKVGMWHC